MSDTVVNGVITLILLVVLVIDFIIIYDLAWNFVHCGGPCDVLQDHAFDWL